MIRFRISHDDGDGRMFFEVRVLPTVAEMRAHVARSGILRTRQEGPSFYGEALALCCPRTQWWVGPDGEAAKVSPRIGFILLNEEHLTPIVVAHELVHAALTYYRERPRNSDWAPADFGESATPDEETFAHIYSGLFRQMNVKLHDRGLWN